MRHRHKILCKPMLVAGMHELVQCTDDARKDDQCRELFQE
jgi:hypothetical protein